MRAYAVRSDHGLELRLSIPAGPYFQTELLPVTLTLTNRSGAPATYYGTPGDAVCGWSMFNLALSQEGKPIYPLALDYFISCPWLRVNPARLLPGASISTRFLRGLPVASRVTITGEADLSGDPHAMGGEGHTARFAAGWPSLTIAVGSAVPTSRSLHIVRRGHTIYVSRAPRDLVGEYAVRYAEGQGSCATGQFFWYPLPAESMSDFTGRDPKYAECSSTVEDWQVMLGAPAFGIFSAVYCFSPESDGIFMFRHGVLQPRDGSTCAQRS